MKPAICPLPGIPSSPSPPPLPLVRGLSSSGGRKMARLALRVLLLALAVGEARWTGPIAVARPDAARSRSPGAPAAELSAAGAAQQPAFETEVAPPVPPAPDQAPSPPSVAAPGSGGVQASRSSRPPTPPACRRRLLAGESHGAVCGQRGQLGTRPPRSRSARARARPAMTAPALQPRLT